MVGPRRSCDCATSAELGHDLRPEIEDAPAEPEHPHVIEERQVPEDADRYPGYPYETCVICGASGRVGALDRFEECGEGREQGSAQEPVEAN
jgi:hypothetical protein